MCTVSWLRSPAEAEGSYQLFFNRDESLARGPEIAPAIHDGGGVRFLAPLDADFGGTWIAVNEFGLSVCVLNGYDERDPSVPDLRDYTSRGLLVTALARSGSVAEIAERLSRDDLDAYRSFLLLALEPAAAALVVEWDGRERRTDSVADPHVPLISSAFRQSEVRTHRTAAFHALRTPHTPAIVEAFHRGHAGGRRGPYSPCMHRNDAATRSMTRIDVGPETIELRYTPGPPCRTEAQPPLRLPRRAAHAARR